MAICGVALIPRHSDVLICTPHSSEFLRIEGDAQSHSFGAGSRFRAPCSRSVVRLCRTKRRHPFGCRMPTYIKGLQGGRQTIFDQPVTIGL